MNFRSLLVFALCFAPLAAFAAPVAAESSIRAVTVYTDRAVVTRTATVALATPGAVEVTFERLPAGLLDQSLTVSGRGTAQATILDVTARLAHVDFTPNDRVKQLEDQLRALAKERRGLDDRTKLLEVQRKGIDQTETALLSPAAKDVPRPSVGDVTAALTFVTDQRATITTEIAALDEQREALAAKQSALERQLAQLRGAGGKSYKTVTVRLDATTAGSLDLTLGYAVHGASWTPSYDVRASSNDGGIALSYFGLVRQNTGEDWKDIALTLSTARPSLGGAAPEIGNWVVEQLVPRPMQGPSDRNVSAWTGGQMARGVETAGKTTAGEGLILSTLTEGLDFASAEASVDTAATSASFKIATAATVPSDNTAQKIPVTSASLTAALEYATTPKRLAAAFLTAKVANSSDFPLLPGAMNIFLDGTFVTTGALKLVMPGEKFDLALGADDGIAVKHKRLQRFTENTGFTNSGQRITYDYLLTIQNNKKAAARVIVSDHVPVSRHEKIGVKQLVPDAREVKPTAEGALKWTLDLKPGEKRELTLKFSIEHPNDMQVAGLEP
ncbi:MAG: mucoidy inhibitor MuiA family protein [Opitutaceae bacterium]|nr:mucoidy inhibitor MuiA family protein [Opitutaceae bacterium]